MSSENRDELLVLLSRVVTAIESQSAAVQELAEELRGRSAPKSAPKVSRQSEAMVWALANNCTDVRAIAERFEVTMRTVRRWSQLRTLLDRMVVTDPTVDRSEHGGYKDHAEFEAWERV